MKRLLTLVCVAAAVGLASAAGTASADAFDITTLPGYEVVTTSPLNFSDTGWAGWSKSGKVVLGAKIISAGDSFSDFSVFMPVGPGTVTPFGYTYGANEYGFLFRDVQNSAGNADVKIELYFADMMAGYTITTSGNLNYSGTGWGGWSAPAGDVVSGGGFAFSNLGSSPASSQIALENSVWPHYTYGSTEQGWVVQNGGVASSANNLYVISFDAPSPPPPPVPEPSSVVALCGLGAMGLAVAWRRLKRTA